MERLNNMTVNDLKELLRATGLATTGNKSELVLRLNQLSANEINKMNKIQASQETRETIVEDTADKTSTQNKAVINRRMVDIYKRKKELAECELAILCRELELARVRTITRVRTMTRVKQTATQARFGDRAPHLMHHFSKFLEECLYQPWWTS